MKQLNHSLNVRDRLNRQLLSCIYISNVTYATFINGCLDNDCDLVNFVARHGVYFRRMLSPIGRNSLFCCRRFGMRLSAIAHINKFFVWAHYQSQLTVSYRRTVHLLLELLFGYLSVACLSQADITYDIDSICTS